MRRRRGGRQDLWKVRRARKVAVSYIASVQRGEIDDPDGNPVRTVSAIYGVTERAVQQWVEASKEAGEFPTLPFPAVPDHLGPAASRADRVEAALALMKGVASFVKKAGRR